VVCWAVLHRLLIDAVTMECADPLAIKALPIPSAQRVDVFVATPDEYLEATWTRYGGTSRFHYPGGGMNTDFAAFCGVALFELFSPPNISAEHFALVQPFFVRAGGEANVFEFDVVRRIFVRRDEAWFDGRVVSS